MHYLLATAIKILLLIESSNLVVPPTGDHGLAVGSLQIHPIMVREVNRICRLQHKPLVFTLENRNVRSKSLHMACIFLQYQYKRYLVREGKPPSAALLICSWNSGSIYRNASPSYRKKVITHLKSRNNI